MDLHYEPFIRKYTHRQLADLYGVCWNTFDKWMKTHERRIGKKIGHFYTARQVRIIVSIYGPPDAWAKAMNGVPS